MSGVTLDAGALIAHERRSRSVELMLDGVDNRGADIAVPAGVLAQVFRDGPSQARLMRLLDRERTEIVPLDELAARLVARICAVTGTSDVVDASVVLCARLRRHAVLTSDPDDLLRIDPSLRVVQV